LKGVVSSVFGLMNEPHQVNMALQLPKIKIFIPIEFFSMANHKKTARQKACRAVKELFKVG
jgi:hypothetical protein